MPTFEEQLINNIQKNAKDFEQQRRAAPAPAPSQSRGIETREVEILNDKGEVIGKQLVEKHSGFHTAEGSETILGKRKAPPRVEPEV